MQNALKEASHEEILDLKLLEYRLRCFHSQ